MDDIVGLIDSAESEPTKRGSTSRVSRKSEPRISK
jgi:hypothetical protein